MTFLETWGKEIVALLVPFITWLLNVGIKPKARLLWATPHSFTFLITEPLMVDGERVADAQNVYTSSVRVINIGREPARNVQITFNWIPHYLNIWPVRPYARTSDADNRHTLTFETLAPKEEIGIELLSINAQLPAIVSVRSDQALGEQIKMAFFRTAPAWRIKAVQFLFFLGAATAIWALIALLQLLILKTSPL